MTSEPSAGPGVPNVGAPERSGLTTVSSGAEFRHTVS